MRRTIAASAVRFTVLTAFALAVGLAAAPAREAEAGGLNLDGRLAPDLVFSGPVTGIDKVSKLSDLKGRVVWLKFWLRDCPICRAALPAVQEAHERWSRAGLVVLTVMHQFQPADYLPFMQQNGYTFPVGTDADGSLARLYGIQKRPAAYLIGIDGRVKSSNGVPTEALLEELGRYRLARLGKVPEAFGGARQKVWQNDLAGAQTDAEKLTASDASEEAKTAAQRIRTLAEEDIEARRSWSAYLVRSRRGPEARQEMDKVVASYRGTALAQKASAAHAAVFPPGPR